MILRFITDYTPEGEHLPVRELSKISKRYLQSSSFIFDSITLIPFAIILRGLGSQVKLFYLIKIIRFMKGLNFFDVDLLYRNIKSIVHTRL